MCEAEEGALCAVARSLSQDGCSRDAYPTSIKAGLFLVQRQRISSQAKPTKSTVSIASTSPTTQQTTTSMQLFPSEAQEQHLDLLLSICDGFLHETSPELIRPIVGERLTDDELVEYTKTVTRPSQIPGVREFLRRTVNKSSTNTIRTLYVLMTVLSLRVLSPVLTGTTTLFPEMSNEQKRAVLLSWRDSPIEGKNKIFNIFLKLTAGAFGFNAPDLHLKAIDYPRRDERQMLYEGYQSNVFDYKFREPPISNGVELYMPEFDVVIIGLGSGAGVAAHTLARDGHKCLVLEKGTYYDFSQTSFSDSDGYQALYENGPALPTENSQVAILAGSTFGGGLTVNWSACLKTPFKVRKEWYDDFGLDFVATELYDKDMDYVFKQMGASTEHITHSKSNQALIDGCTKLGYKCKPIEQNNGVHENHDCGFCHLGCKWGVKQGSLGNWLRDAAEYGTEFMEQVRVDRILRNKHNTAVGLECTNLRNNYKFTIKGPKKFIVSAGLLHTPVLLQKLGFRNKHIGANLKLHPITSLLVVWDERKTDPFHHSIMTSVCNEAEDLNGKYHGAKIETLVHTPAVEGGFIPWESSEQFRQDLLKYQSTSAYILLDRDTSSGTVTFDKSKPNTLKIDYVVNQFDRDAINTAILYTMDFAYIEGAIEIIHPFWKAGKFKSNKPKAQRALADADYQEYRQKCAGLKLLSYGVSYGSAHQMSTCRMSGKGSKYGACDTNGRLFECDNVYVADASLMPTASGANPMVSTMALSRHVSRALSQTLSPKAKL